MSKHHWSRFIPFLILLLVVGVISACNLSLHTAAEATATPTKTPRPVAMMAASPTATLALQIKTAVPTPVPTDTAAPTSTPVPPTPTPPPLSATPLPPTATPMPPTAVPPTAPPPPPTDTPAPPVDFVISELRVLGQGENNGGIEGPGAGRTIFITVLDAAGNPLDGAVIVNDAPYPGRAVSGDKGPGKAEILMDREVFRLKVESVSGAPVTSEVSHNMSLIDPVPQDIAGKLGDTCQTVENCPLPPYKHFSYVITFRRTH